jgi:hypothetical protein
VATSHSSPRPAGTQQATSGIPDGNSTTSQERFLPRRDMKQQPDGLSSVARRVRDFWHDEGARPRTGLSAQDIHTAEARLRVRFSDDVAEFFLVVNGTKGTCGDLFEAWSLDRVAAVPDVLEQFRGTPDYGPAGSTLPHAAEYFVFADAMVWSQVFAVRMAPNVPTEAVWISGSTFASVAPTFEAFWERYLVDPDSVVWPRRATIQSRLS